MRLLAIIFGLLVLLTPLKCNAESFDMDYIYENYTQDEIDLMARVVMSEASVLDDDAKQLIAEVILNRVDDPKFPNTVTKVITKPKQFSTQNNGTPTQACYDAVYAAITYRSTPPDLLWFRTKYVKYGYEYIHIGNTYFSTRTDYDSYFETRTDELDIEELPYDIYEQYYK